MLESLCLFVDLVPAVAEHLDEEHLQEAVMADELEGDLPALACQLLPAVPILRDEPRDHLADRRRGDAEALGQVARGHGTRVAVQVVEGFEVILLGLGEGAAPREFDHDLGCPKDWDRYAYHKV